MTKPNENLTVQSRRDLLKNMVLLAGLGAGSTLFPAAAFAQAARGGQPGRGGAPAQPATGSTLILLGTQGGPNINLDRSESASVLVVNGQPYLIDCGYGTLRALVQAAVRLADVTNVFVTHLHDDHTSDIAAFLSSKWTASATPSRANIYGPYGTKAMVEGAIAFFKGNTDIRMVDEGRTVKPETVFAGHDVSAPKVTEAFRDERVTVLAMENTHFPDRAKEKMPYRSFAYRFNTPARSFVFSGDTAYSPGVVELATGADVFVCEAVSMATRAQQLQQAARGAATGTESISRHVLETHSSTEDVGRMAAEAKVKTVVLNHLLGAPGPRGDANADPFTADVKKFFSGDVIVGKDQMHI